jgi:hypothetical protein
MDDAVMPRDFAFDWAARAVQLALCRIGAPTALSDDEIVDLVDECEDGPIDPDTVN